MSDVGDVNKAHMQDEPKDTLDLYTAAARRLTGPNSTINDRLAFNAFHTASNVAALGDRIESLRIENAALLESLWGENPHD